MSKRLKISFLAIVAVLCFSLVSLMPINKGVADTVNMQSETDSFTLMDTSYQKDEKFVYTATVSFENGVAAGLVFGAEENSHYWVFNVDRKDNRVKLLYFYYNEDNLVAVELITDYFIGNDKMTQSEKELVGEKVKTLYGAQLKVVITPEDDGVYAEFYADNIRRFGVENVIKLDQLEKLPDGVTYNGGQIGFNCFNASVGFNDVYYGQSDYSYYTELYRNQYHFSQYANWNNDPNGLVYYDGYYHVYYQHHPYSNYWSDMYWGHARSKDLAHWELLPICLFPDRDYGDKTGAGYMWSGSAYEYRKGDSVDIDNLNWFENGNGNGLIAFYTRDGDMQDQMIMSSDDGGMTWTKRKEIPQETATKADNIQTKVACRDPKVFPIAQENGKTTAWGMALTGQQANKVWFLKSTNLLDWSYAGQFSAQVPECPDVVTLTADDGKTFTVITLSAREYVVGILNYDGNNITFTDKDGGEIDQSDFQVMDFGPDSYATQTFSIRDSASAYYGKAVSMSWYAGVPADTDSGIYANARKVWNGSGLTIPVIWGLAKQGDGYVLTQTPVVKDSAAFTKTDVVNISNQVVDQNSENVLSSVNTQVFELASVIDNPSGESISIKINVGQDEYTEIGWTKEEGYFVDRRFTSSAGLKIRDYHNRYVSGPTNATKQSFYILSDKGGVEVFCDDFKVPFYVLTLASPCSAKAEFSVSGQVTVESLTLKEISTVWRSEKANQNETVLHVSDQKVELDTVITTEKLITAYSTEGGEIVWTIESGEEVVMFEKVESGIILKALKEGNATLIVTCGNQTKTIDVEVYLGKPETDIPFTVDGIVSGSWHAKGNAIVGSIPAGDGYLLSTQSASDFDCSITFSLEATAAAFIFRATENMDEYIIFNYDDASGLVKMWSQNGQIASANVGKKDLSRITLRVQAKGVNVKAYINSQLVIDTVLDADEPTVGLFGLNVFSGKATFRSVVNVIDKYTFDATADLSVKGDTNQAIKALYNKTTYNQIIDPAFYTVDGRTLTIKQSYFERLAVGSYTFKAVGNYSSYEFTVEVTNVSETKLQDLTINKGTNAVIYLGNVSVNTVSVNGKELDENQYKIQNKTLTIYASALTESLNEVVLNGDKTVSVSITNVGSVQVESEKTSNVNTGLIIGVAGGAVVLIAGCVSAFIIIRRKKKVGDDN